jgi:putative ABC transport system permease protein
MRRFIYELNESFRIAFTQIIANKLRSALTALGVIIGIVSVTMMGTAILGIDASVEKSFSGFGDDVLYVTPRPWSIKNDWWMYRNRPNVRVEYAQWINDYIEDRADGLLKVAVPTTARSLTIVRGDLRLSNIFALGAPVELSRISKTDIAEGRFFNDFESQAGRNVLAIGFDVADALFPGQSPVGETLRLGGQQFTVVGVIARQGKFLGLFSMDSMVIMPLNALRRYFAVNGDNTQIRVQVDATRMEAATDELRGVMRRLRMLSPEKPDNFAINEQKLVREQIDPIKNGIAIGGLMITGLALFVGAINIMNITYVSVKERTKEIGTRKALGARRRTILLQFLIEAVSICLVGGAIGLLGAGTISSLVTVVAPDFPLVFSPVLVVVGFFGSVLIGILAGIAPAWSASKLDPVVALRYE